MMKIGVLVSYLIMVGVNAAAVSLPINGVETGAVSDMYANLFAPAGLTFSIWGLIYMLLAGFVIYQFEIFTKFKGGVVKMMEKLRKYFVVTSAINSIWIFAWHYDQMFLTLVLMVMLLYFLIKSADAIRGMKLGAVEKIFTKIPFGVYFGWITVATIANVTVYLVSVNWNGWGISESMWTMVILMVGMLIGVWRTMWDRNVVYGLTLVWAYTGIVVKHLSPGGFAGQYPEVYVVAMACVGLLAVFSLVTGLKKG